MIAAFFTPDGIVMATSAYNRFTASVAREEEQSRTQVLQIPATTHIVTFWDRYALLFRQADENRYNAAIPRLLQAVCERWANTGRPPIADFMPYLKKQILDCEIQIIGVMGGYAESDDGMGEPEPFVYQILGSDMRRINLDNSGSVTYDSLCLEMNPVVSRFIREVKMRNGDEWELQPQFTFHTGLYSADMALLVAGRLLQAADILRHLEAPALPPPRIESVVITPTHLTVNQPR